MSNVRLYLRLTRLAVVLAIGTLLAALLVPIERLTRRDLTGLRQRLTRWWLARLARALPFRVCVRGQLPHKPMLWLSNHISWTDIPLLGMLAPLSFLSKAEVRTWPLAGWLAHKAGTLFIRRGAGDGGLLNQQLGRHLKGGRHLLIFPEGTTCDGAALRPFHGRLLSSAIESGVDLQPVAIRYVRGGQRCDVTPFIGDDDMLSHLLRLMRSDVAKVEIQLLEPIASNSGNRNDLARRAQAAVSEALYGAQQQETQAAA